MTATASFDTGLQLARDKQYDQAVMEFTSLLLQDQTHADVYFYRGCAYLHLGQYEKSIDDFSSAISSGNLSPKQELAALYKRGYAYYKINQFEFALDNYQRYLKQCKNHQEQNSLLHKGLFQMGIISAALHKNELAIRYFTEAIESSGDTEEDRQKLYYLHRGRAYACNANYDEAQADLQFILEQSNDLFVKGCAYNELGQHRNALTEFDNLLESNGNGSQLVHTYHDHILFRQGLSCASLHLHDQAITYFQSALNYSKQQSSSNITDRIFFRKGISHMKLDHPHKALIDFNESTKMNDQQSDVFYARGMLHYKLGRHDAAVYDQRTAMELERKSLSSAPIYNILYHTDKYYKYYYYENKIHEAEELLKKYKGTSNEPIIRHEKAGYLQQQAPYSPDPLKSYASARNDIMNARASSYESPTANSIALVINNIHIIHYLAENYSTGAVPETAIEQYINCIAERILRMSKLFDQCVIQRDWRELRATLHSELNKANLQQSDVSKIVIMYINNQLEKVETMEKTMKLFADSPVQQEFYGLLFNRLWNLFDSVRSASTGIVSHQLQGTYTKVSWVFKLLGQVFAYVPMVGQSGQQISCLCEAGLKKIDETRIQNALDHIGRLCNPMIANQIADAIVTELTKMYENQIKRFSSQSEEKIAAAANNNQEQPSTICSKCASCFEKCCHCLHRQKNRLLNGIDISTIETIIEYGASLALSCLTRFKVEDISKAEDIQNAFINGICRPSKGTVFHIMALADKIKPKDAKNDKERWDTYDFFRRPAIDFENGTIRAQKETDIAKFGCRKATSVEKELFQTTPEALDKLGFKIIIKNDTSS
jgi:tetratricopeptide (TPR) repeat protein